MTSLGGIERDREAAGFPEDSFASFQSGTERDPTKVTRTAPQNAASIAGLMITTECLVADKREEEKKMPGGPPFVYDPASGM